MMLLLVAGAAALVAPGSRPSGAVACRGATYDYCVQALGCTAAEATKAERRIMPNIAEWITFARIEESCGWLQSSLDLSDAELKKMVLTFPHMLSLSVENNVAPKLDWLQKRLDLGDAQLRKLVMTRPQLLGLSIEDNLQPTVQWFRGLGLSDTQVAKAVDGFFQRFPFPCRRRSDTPSGHRPGESIYCIGKLDDVFICFVPY